MLNENKTSTKNIVLTIIAMIFGIASILIATIPTMEVVLPVLSGSYSDSDATNLAWYILIIVYFGLIPVIMNIISTVLSVISASSIKKNGESKSIYVLDLITAILPWAILVLDVALYFIALGIAN